MIKFCYAAISYPYELEDGKLTKPFQWNHFQRERKFYQYLGKPNIDYLLGIGDGMFESDGKYYILDWKSNLKEAELPHNELYEFTREDFKHQIFIYSHNLLNNLCFRESSIEERKKIYSEKFGGMLFVYLRGLKGGKSGYVIIKPTYEEIMGYIDQMVKIA
jgi:ATP-dependent exoDNAse (exonuclease V) beta subunit